MSWAEAIRHTITLARDPSSHVCASLEGWDYPVSREWLVLKAIHDKFVASKFKKPWPVLPAPWDEKAPRWGTPLTKERLDAILSRHRALPASVQEAEIRGG
jgi:hypothetical protein